jgi:biopolymer transport protein ExbB/TolQ
MKAVGTFCMMVLLVLTLYNGWEIRHLRQELDRLNHQVKQTPPNLSDQVVAEVTRALAHAREAIEKMDLKHAQNTVEEAQKRLEEAGRSASQKVKPTLRWLGEQVSALGKQIQQSSEARR